MNSFGVKTSAVVIVTIIATAAVVYGIINFFFPNPTSGGSKVLSLDPAKAYVAETTILQRARGTIKSISRDSLTLVAGSDEVAIELDPSVEVVKRQGASLEKDIKLEEGQLVEVTSSYIYGRPFVGKVVVIIGQ